MPIPELSDRYDAAVMWPASGNDAYGRFTVSTVKRVQLMTRWNSTFSEQVAPDGNTIALDATVIVDRLIPVGSVMWKGTVAQLSGGLPTSDVYEVKTQTTVQDVKGRISAYTVGLMRYRGTLPQVN